jgi:hypothetical protein
LPAVFGLNRPRLDLTGLEEPDELWERLRESSAQANALAANNKKLASRVRLLERRLAEAGGLTDDELVAELPKRMSRALESAQGVAAEIVRRAKKQEAVLRQQAEESAAALVRQAEVEAGGILRRAAGEAAARIASAETQALDIVGGAHTRRDQVMRELEGQAVTLRQRIKLLEKSHDRLLQAYDVVAQTLHVARSVLGPLPPVASPGSGAVGHGDEPAPPDGRGETASGAAPKPGAESGADDTRVGVYDWSPATSQAG